MARYYKSKYSSRATSFPRSPVVESKPIVHTDATAQRWQNLLKYYASCISIENSGEITLFSTKEGSEYIVAPSAGIEWVMSGKEHLEIKKDNAGFANVMKGPRWSKTPVSFFYGYPCNLKTIEQSRRGWSGKVIQPLLIFGVDVVQSQDGYTLALQSDRPRINSAFLSDKNMFTSTEERKHIAEAVLENWDEEASRGDNLRKTINTFTQLLSQNVTISPNVATGRTAEMGEQNGIVPMGVVFRSADSKYTRGLEQEINELKNNTSPNDIWRLILDRNGAAKEADSRTYLEITALNDEQRSAIKSAFSNTLTVITGPPGTGKSQVVLNIIANALTHNESVLFGSKNHKAVDVVIERLFRSQTEPIILKYGEKDREIQFAESLLSAIERASGYDAKKLESEIQSQKTNLDRFREEEADAQNALLKILDRRNRISRCDAKMDQIRKNLPVVIAAELKANIRIDLSKQFSKKTRSADRLVAQCRKAGIGTKILDLFGHTLDKRLSSAARDLLKSLPIKHHHLGAESRSQCLEVISISRGIDEWVSVQADLLQIVKETASEPSVEMLRQNIATCGESVVDVSIKYVDLLMRKRLKSLGPIERKNIADYVSIVRRLDGDVTGGELAEELRKERKQMFKSVVRAFPAIAVTNLSVRHALPLSKDVVDMVVIDEASQCDIASAAPLLYRAKRAIVIGDPNQLTHISSLHKADDQQLQHQHNLKQTDDQRFLYSICSLFEMCRSVIGSGAKFTHLLEHYRSRAEIIGFSNKRFYGGKLSVWTDYRKLRGGKVIEPVIWHDTVGETVRPSQGSAYNLEEAKQVAQLIDKLVARFKNNPISLGVVTPFRDQANKIKDIVEQRVSSSTLRDFDFVVDTAHKYQGDERDIMIFSPVISKNAQQRSLGFLSNTVNLFNVAITRPRSELHIVGDRASCAKSGISHLADFVKYVDELKLQKTHESGGKFESPWEEVLFKALAAAGIKSIPQYPIHQYRLDLAVLDSNIPINIEIDGEHWHRDIDGGRLMTDMKRDYHMIINGWQVKRFWVYQIQHALESCVSEIKTLIRSQDEVAK